MLLSRTARRLRPPRGGPSARRAHGAAPAVGDVLRERRRFAREDVEAFARLTGDANAIHRVATPPFDAPVVHGLLLAAVFPAGLRPRNRPQ